MLHAHVKVGDTLPFAVSFELCPTVHALGRDEAVESLGGLRSGHAGRLWDSMTIVLQAAALALVEDGGLVLTVGRPSPPYEQALPGGGVDRGESPRRAALRELEEEVGVIGSASSARLVFVGISPTDGRLVYVYLVTRWRGTPYAREGLPVAWMTPEELVSQGARYGGFTWSLFRALGWPLRASA